MIELFTANTPNGIKIPLALEEFGKPYVLRRVNLGSQELKTESFLKLNPNAKIPAIRHVVPDMEEVTLFESGAILLYLAETFDGLKGHSPPAKAQTLSWLFLQVAGSGPMMGNAGHFRSLKSPDPYALARFEGEASRYMKLLEVRLSEQQWLNSESYSIADIAHFCWARRADYAGLNLADFPATRAWVERIEARPATITALAKLA